MKASNNPKIVPFILYIKIWQNIWLKIFNFIKFLKNYINKKL